MIEQAEAGIHTPVLSADEAPAASRRAIAGRIAVTGPATGPARPGRHRPHPRSSSGLPTPRPVSRRDGGHRTHPLSRPAPPRWPARPRPAGLPVPPARRYAPRPRPDARTRGGPRPIAAPVQCAPTPARSLAQRGTGADPDRPPAPVRDIRFLRRKTDGAAQRYGHRPGARSRPGTDSLRIARPERFA